jgi:hypothetical protein
MPLGKTLSASPAASFALFDPDERKAFVAESGLSEAELVARASAPDLLIWIVQRRSSFLRMATESVDMLTRIEASIRGNIELIVSVYDGRFRQQQRYKNWQPNGRLWVESCHCHLIERTEALHL